MSEVDPWGGPPEPYVSETETGQPRKEMSPEVGIALAALCFFAATVFLAFAFSGIR